MSAFENLTSAIFQIEQEKPYDYLLITQTGKNLHGMFLEAIFPHLRKRLSEFRYKLFVIALHDIIGLQNFSLSFCQS